MTIKLSNEEWMDALVLVEEEEEKCNDLYAELIREPLLLKNQSLNYDYQPHSSYPCTTIHDKTQPQQPMQLTSQSQDSSQQNSVTTVRCTCVKSKCQKNYCQCFKAGRSCGESCSCIDCHNKEGQIEKLAFQPQKSSGGGCKCRKSHCQKKYCECFSAGRACGKECQCVDCENVEGSDGMPKKRVKMHYQP